MCSNFHTKYLKHADRALLIKFLSQNCAERTNSAPKWETFLSSFCYKPFLQQDAEVQLLLRLLPLYGTTEDLSRPCSSREGKTCGFRTFLETGSRFCSLTARRRRGTKIIDRFWVRVPINLAYGLCYRRSELGGVHMRQHWKRRIHSHM